VLGPGVFACADNSLTGVSVTSPVGDICIGEPVTYKVTYAGGDPVQSVQWQATCTDCVPQTTVTLGSSSSVQINTTATKLGNFTIKAIVTFSRLPAGGTYQQTKTVNILVNPPDHIKLSNGAAVLGVNLTTVTLAQGPNTPFLFTLLRGARAVPCGGMPVEFVHHADPAYADHHWTDSVPFMSISANTLTDMKGLVGDANYQAFANGVVVDEIDQNIGVKLPTGCGGTLEVHFPETFHFRFVKIDNANFQIVSP